MQHTQKKSKYQTGIINQTTAMTAKGSMRLKLERSVAAAAVAVAANLPCTTGITI